LVEAVTEEPLSEEYVSPRKEATTDAAGALRPRAVLLGASNLTRGISTAIATAAAYWGQPLDVFAALGHGRSYGMHSSVLGRRLCGILDCGLWDALAKQPSAPTAALITDIGNDLLFEAPPEQIAEWVDQCLDRLQALGARTVMTMLPLANSVGISEGRYLFLRNCFYAGCHLSLNELLARARILDERLRANCTQRGVAVVEHQRNWYGFDPIHIRRRQWPAAWAEILSAWCNNGPLEVPRPPRGRELYLRLLAPEQRWFFGIERRKQQPAGRLPGGSTVAIY
jgi:hypothetical protein